MVWLRLPEAESRERMAKDKCFANQQMLKFIPNMSGWAVRAKVGSHGFEGKFGKIERQTKETEKYIGKEN